MAVLTANPHFSNYQIDGINNVNDSLTAVHPKDSGNIKGNPVPGGSAESLTSGVPQRASILTSSSAAGAPGNALNSTSGENLVPTPPANSNAAAGMSQAPQRE